LTRRRRIAVIGAGVAGLACARRLQESGAEVEVFERDAHPSGRAATLIDGDGPFDHGAQYFTASDSRFAAALAAWQAAGVAARWEGRIVAIDASGVSDKTASAERFVAVPGMRRLGIHLAQGLPIRYSTAIACLRWRDGWWLQGQGVPGDLGPFDTVLAAVPSALAAELMQGATPLAEQARAVRWEPCWAATLALSQRCGVGFDGAFINHDPILSWTALDSGKPRRGQVEGVAERWVLHARAAWSHRYRHLDANEAARWISRSFAAAFRGRSPEAHARGWFWPHAKPVNPLPSACLWDGERRLGMAGDWCGGPRIEGAYLSGLALAEAALA